MVVTSSCESADQAETQEVAEGFVALRTTAAGAIGGLETWSDDVPASRGRRQSVETPHAEAEHRRQLTLSKRSGCRQTNVLRAEKLSMTKRPRGGQCAAVA